MDYEIIKAEKFLNEKNYNAALNVFKDLSERYPENPQILAKIGLIYQLLNNFNKAILFYEKSLKLNPGQRDILNNLGCLYISLNKYPEAMKCLKSDLDIYENLFNLGILFEKIGKIKKSRKCFYNAIKKNPKKRFLLSTKIAFLIPPISESKEEIFRTRKKILDFIDRHLNEDFTIENPIFDIGTTTFYLGYQGLCNKEINSKIADFYLKHLNKELIVENKKKQNNKRIKIGFISSFFRKHSVSDVSNGWISQLNSKIFEKIIFSIGEIRDKSTEILEKNSDRFFYLPKDFYFIQKKILDENLDILFFTDIGLEPFTYFLAFSRYAPVQITYSGHPDTTGIPNIDYYISTKLWEKDNSEEHYSENLIKFNSIPWYYNKPIIKELNLSREFYGFNDKDNIYCINQSLFKIHPDFDEILNKIINIDKKAKIAIFYDASHYWWKDILLKRFEDTVSNIDKIRFIPKLKFDYYLNFVKLSDVVLDTIYFNGGTTSLQTFSTGTPIVTLPSNLMRGRFTYGMYQRMGIDDLITDNIDEYVNCAVEVANNKEKQKELRKKVLSKNYILFNDKNVIRDFEKLFLEIVK